MHDYNERGRIVVTEIIACEVGQKEFQVNAPPGATRMRIYSDAGELLADSPVQETLKDEYIWYEVPLRPYQVRVEWQIGN